MSRFPSIWTAERQGIKEEALGFNLGPWFNTEFVIFVVSKIEVQFDRMVDNKDIIILESDALVGNLDSSTIVRLCSRISTKDVSSRSIGS